jgi:hypothetical protein
MPGPEEHWIGLVGLIAHSDHHVERPVEVALKRLAFPTGDFNAELLHCADRPAAHASRLGASRVCLEALFAQLTQQTLRHLASR